MALPNIVELTDAEILERNEHHRFRRQFSETDAIGPAYDGKYALMVVLAVNINPTEEQIAGFIADVEALAGIYKALPMVGPARIPVDKVDAGEELKIGVTGEFRIGKISAL